MELSVSNFFKAVKVGKEKNEIILNLTERDSGLPRFVRLTMNEARSLAVALDVVTGARR